MIDDRRQHHRVAKQSAIVVKTDEVRFACENVLLLGADDEIVDDRIVYEPDKQNEARQYPTEGQNTGQHARPGPFALGRRGKAVYDGLATALVFRCGHPRSYFEAAAASFTLAMTSSALFEPPTSACRPDNQASATRGGFAVSSQGIR